jgi:hypothetical protein
MRDMADDWLLSVVSYGLCVFTYDNVFSETLQHFSIFFHFLDREDVAESNQTVV